MILFFAVNANYLDLTLHKIHLDCKKFYIP